VLREQHADANIIHCTLTRSDALSSLIFNFVLQHAIRKVQVIQDGLKLNGTHQFLVYADDVNILGGSVYILKAKTQIC